MIPDAKVSATVVVPCFNEETALPCLREKLASVRRLLGHKYEIHLILVDDRSKDGTWRVMQELFGAEPNCLLLQQPENLGIAAAIATGIRRAETEIVCSIDCDCTYDPHDLERLIPLLKPGVDLVTGSPYHPFGRVQSVPNWRLVLSKTASALYRRVMRQKLYTCTSCFRVYRRSAILGLDLRRNGFLGVAELIGKLDLQGSVIVECPTTLMARVHGVSKMRVARVLFGHLYLLCELLVLRGRQVLFTSRPIDFEFPNFEESGGAAT
jgi:glycosyltransferase involved in cell wall biosynthesis